MGKILSVLVLMTMILASCASSQSQPNSKNYSFNFYQAKLEDGIGRSLTKTEFDSAKSCYLYYMDKWEQKGGWNEARWNEAVEQGILVEKGLKTFDDLRRSEKK